MKVQQILKIWVILAMVAFFHVACSDAGSIRAGSSATLTGIGESSSHTNTNTDTLPPGECSNTYHESIIWESISANFLSILF